MAPSPDVLAPAADRRRRLARVAGVAGGQLRFLARRLRAKP